MSLGNQGLAITLAYCLVFVVGFVIWDKRRGRSFFATDNGDLVLRPTLRNFGKALCIPAIFVVLEIVGTIFHFGGCASDQPFLCTGLPNAEEGCLEPSDCAKIVVRGEHNEIRRLPSAYNAWGKTTGVRVTF